MVIGLIIIAVKLTALAIDKVTKIKKQREENDLIFRFAMCMAGNSAATSYDVGDGVFGKNTQKKCKDMLTRISIFENVGKEGYLNK